MSTGNLISSLFRDNSFSSRSNSLFQKSFLVTEPVQQRARSQSVYTDKNANQGSLNKYLPVARMVHSLSVKIKKINYFFYCRLQANLKKHRKNIQAQQKQVAETQTAIVDKPVPPKIQSGSSQGQKKITEQAPYEIVVNSQKQIQNSILQNQQNKQKECNYNNSQKISQSLSSLSQIFQIYQLKYFNPKNVDLGFSNIRKHSSFREGIRRIYAFFSRSRVAKTYETFKAVQKFQQLSLKTQIFTHTLFSLFQPLLSLSHKQVRQCAIKRKIEDQLKKRQINQKQQIANHPSGNSSSNIANVSSFQSRLHSISEQSSILSLSEQQYQYHTKKFGTPPKNLSNNHTPLKNRSGKSNSKNHLGIELKNPSLFLKKQYLELTPEKDRRKKCHFFQQSEEKTSSKVYRGLKSSTKKQPQRPRIMIGKAYHVQTSLVDTNPIKTTSFSTNFQKETMLKHNRLYSENICHMLPDLHDNIGVFQNKWSQEESLTHRNFQNLKNSCLVTESQTQNHCRQQSDVKTIEYPHIIKDNITKSMLEINSRVVQLNNINTFESGIEGNIDLRERNTSRQRLISKMCKSHQFYSSPLEKIEEMMIDLQKLREREKYNTKFLPAYQKCKISVNLSKKNIEDRSCQNSAKKLGKVVNLNESRSEKRQLRNYSQNTSAMKSKEQKQNIEIKICDQRDGQREKHSFKFYADNKSAAKQRKNSCYNSSLNQSEINTARKMKKQIEDIIKKRKSKGQIKTCKTRS